MLLIGFIYILMIGFAAPVVIARRPRISLDGRSRLSLLVHVVRWAFCLSVVWSVDTRLRSHDHIKLVVILLLLTGTGVDLLSIVSISIRSMLHLYIVLLIVLMQVILAR